MRKMPSVAEYRKKILIVMAAVLFLLHAMYIPFNLIYNYNLNDIAYETILNVLYPVLLIISLLLKYFLYGTLLTVYDNYTLRQSVPFTVTAILSLLLSRIGEIITFAYTAEALQEGEAQSVIYSILLSFVIDVAVVIILLIATKSAQPKRIPRFTLLSVLICFIVLCSEYYNIVVYLDAGLLIFEDTLSEIWCYTSPLVKAAGGFLILTFVNIALTKPANSKKNTK